MSDDSKRLAPAPIAPSPSPTLPEPKATPAPQRKAPRIPPKVVEMADALLEGRARNLSQAAELVGCTRQYASQVFKQRPDCVAYVQQRAARALGISSAVAAAKMQSLIHAESEHVSFRAADRVLGINGIAPPRDPQVSVNVSVRSGYILDLRERDAGPLPDDFKIEEGRAGAVIVDAKPIDAEPTD